MPVQRKRQGSVLEKPASGWLHDDRGMQAGRGVFFSFQCNFVGTIEMKASLRGNSVMDQTEIAREALTKVVEAAGEVTRPYGDQEVHPAAAKFAYGDPNVMRVPCTLCMSSKAVIVAQPEYDPEGDHEIQVVVTSSMRLVSLAAGGEDEFYDYFVYVGKDKATGKRDAFVFNGAPVTDQILQTLGQAFDLAAKEASKPKPKKAGKAAVAHEAAAAIYDSAAAIDPSIADAFAIPEEVDEMIYDVAQAGGVPIDDAPHPELDPLYDTAKNDDGTVDDIATELMGLMTQEANCIYDTAGGAGGAPAEPTTPDIAHLCEVLNENDAMAHVKRMSSKVEVNISAKKEARPTWVYFKPANTIKKLSMDEMREMYGADGSGDAAALYGE